MLMIDSNPAIAAGNHGKTAPGFLGVDRWLNAFGAAAIALGLWLERRRSRHALAQLDDRLLRDVGLTRLEARQESAVPFWKA